MFCIVYLNNILIYLKNEKNYAEYIIKIFIKFWKAELQVNIKKCKFKIIKMKYLKFIIIIKKIKINLKKMKIIYN